MNYLFTIVAAILIFVSCAHDNKSRESNDTLPKQIELTKSDTSMKRKAVVFKNWLADTLCLIARKDSFVLGADSLMLTVTHFHKVKILHGRIDKNEDASEIVKLLKNCKELQSKPFTLCYLTVFEYTSTPLEGSPYEEYSYPDKITVHCDGDSAISEYGYLRGRLSDKIVKTASGKVIQRIEL